MKNLKSLLLTTALTCGAGLLMGQQQSPPPANSPQNSQDVPHQTPGSNNPDLQQQRKPGAQQSPGTNTPAQPNPGDVPHQQPGTNNPDMGQQRHPGTAPKGQTTKPKRKTKHKKQDSATSS